jgi:copper chaperone CopZ
MATTTTYKIGGMHCPSCSMLIEMNVSDLDGVESVKASNADCSAVVSYDASKVDAACIAEEIRNAGYEVEIVA